MKNKWVWMLAGLAVAALLIYRFVYRTGDGWPPHDGKLRQTASIGVDGVRRGAKGHVGLDAIAHYMPPGSDSERVTPVPRISEIELALVDAAGAARPIAVDKWQRKPGSARGELTLPDVPDGDYTLRARFKTRLGKDEVEVPVPLYTPARIHVITDRPLYEPGNLVQFRAVVLRARDLAPLDGRPGRWVIRNPSGDVLLEEKAPAGDWGVVAGSFPLDKQAEVGDWTVAWVSDEASDEIPFAVQPFTLPRFQVEARAPRPFYRPREAPVLRGSVLYSSGAPVAGAAVEITWRVVGAWPPPAAWTEGALPSHATTGPSGGFDLTLPEVPADLQGQATLVAQLAATDPAGDRVEGTASVLLSSDGITASSVTEIGDGLVEGFNNRMYLRVTTPDGAPLPGAKINVRRAWLGDEPGLDATLDDDSVASVQFDPGPPVNVVVPAQPWRPAPRPALVSRGQARDLIGDEGASLADQIEMDRWLTELAPCARWYSDDHDWVVLGLAVTTGGALTQVAASSAASLDQCAAAVVRRQRLPAGASRLYSVRFEFTDPDLPTLTPSIASALGAPDGLDDAIEDLARSARDCLPMSAEGDLPRKLAWSARAGRKDVTLGPWMDDPDAGTEAAAAMACVTARLAGARVTLDEEADNDGLGVIQFEVSLPERLIAQKPQPTTMLGYELLITADVEGQPTTTLRVAPGTIPDLRLRVWPVLARPGDTVTAQLIRGPGFASSGRRLPEKLTVHHLRGDAEVKVGADHQAKVTIEAGTEGWVEIRGGGERGLVYVRPDDDLAVSLTPKRDRYAPGDQAELQVHTAIGGKGGPAAVGLFGVDASLGQLVPLPGPDVLERLRPTVVTDQPAFALLDGQALTLGRIRGANAAAATVLRVTEVPGPPALDAVVTREAVTHFDPIEELTDRFYVVLAELHVQTRQWEASAPAGELMHPKQMAKLWNQALAACERRGESIVDAYGRKLRLAKLPGDLLALTDPRAVVIEGTRLPEDVEDWAAWVAKEKP